MLLCGLSSDAHRSMYGVPERCRSCLSGTVRNTARLACEPVGVAICWASDGPLLALVKPSLNVTVSVAPPTDRLSEPAAPGLTPCMYALTVVLSGAGQPACVVHWSGSRSMSTCGWVMTSLPMP